MLPPVKRQLPSLMELAILPAYASGLRLPPLHQLPKLKELVPGLSNVNAASYIVSPHITAVALPNTRSDYPIVIYVDLHNRNILAVFYEHSNRTFRYDLDSTDKPPIMSGYVTIESLLERISNGLLPNCSHALSDRLYEAIKAYASNISKSVTIGVKDMEHLYTSANRSRNSRVSLAFLHPRHTDDIVGILRGLMTQYNVRDEVPTDLLHSADKTWVFHAQHNDHPNSYLELEIRQAQRSVDRGFEFRIVDPGYRRRIIDVDGLRFS